jgi:hypothetical protein
MAVHSSIHVFVNNRKVTLLSNRITGSELIRLAGYSEPKHWNLYRLQSETDETGGTMVTCDDTLHINDGDWFRLVEGHQSCV